MASDCSSVPADREVGAVDRPDVVQAEEPALEHVAALLVLQVDPPREVDQQLVEYPAQEVEVPAAVDGEDLQGGHACTGGLMSPKSHS